MCVCVCVCMCVSSSLQERVLACLAAQMLSRGSDGRASAHVARLVRSLCQFVLPNHEVHLQDSGILEALISDIQTNTVGVISF